MQVDFDQLMRYHEEGKLRHSKHPDRDLHVFCYSQETVYSRNWDEVTRMCRGLVVDSTGFVCSRPFPKFFNWGEPEAVVDMNSMFWAYDKMDGSLIVVGTDRHGERVVSTKGSFTTWHSEKAATMLGDWKPREGWTAMFEFIDPLNRIVLDYHGRSELVLLGAVEHETGEDHYTPDDVADGMGWDGAIVPSQSFNLRHMLNTVADPEAGNNREGFVLVYPTPDGPSPRVKLKFAQYVNLHRVLSRLSNVAVWEALSEGTFDALLEVVPDELYEQVRECADELSQAFEESLIRHRWVAAEATCGRTTRKEQAEYILAHDNDYNPRVIFAILDEKSSVEQLVWDSVKPELDRSWAFLK